MTSTTTDQYDHEEKPVSTTTDADAVTITPCASCGTDAKVYADGSRVRCQACGADPVE